MALHVGLTGTIGSGKTTVAAMLVQRAAELLPSPAACVIDADALAREAVEPGQPALEAIAREFGPEFIGPDGRLRRGDLARLVFNDRAALARLNAIVHPQLREAELWQMRAAEAEGRQLIVLDIPLLFEAGMQEMVDRTVVVTVGEARRFARLKRRGIGERDAIARLGMQMPQSRKRALADVVIDNDGALDETRRQVVALLERWNGEGLLGDGWHAKPAG